MSERLAPTNERRSTTDVSAGTATIRQGDQEISTATGLPVSRSPGLPSPAAVDLQIGELVLHGFAPGDRQLIGAAIERELARLLSERGWAPQASGAAAHIDVDAFRVAHGASPETIGAQIAQTVFGGLNAWVSER